MQKKNCLCASKQTIFKSWQTFSQTFPTIEILNKKKSTKPRLLHYSTINADIAFLHYFDISRIIKSENIYHLASIIYHCQFIPIFFYIFPTVIGSVTYPCGLVGQSYFIYSCWSILSSRNF